MTIDESGHPAGIAGFAAAAARVTSGVTVITTTLDGRPYGSTVAAVVPFSEDPPLMLTCMNRSSSTHGAVAAAGLFAINVLAEEQGWIARRFAGKGDKFAGIPFGTCGETGAPLLDGAIASISCRLSDTLVGGTHSGLLGEAVACDETAGHPLTYYGGSFGRWERLREHDTYDQIRHLVLQRDVPLGADLDAVALASRIDARPDDVHNALVRLTTESLVLRLPDGRFQPAPIRFDLIENLYDARSSIELGVVANHIGRIPESVLRRLENLVERMQSLREGPQRDPGEFLSLHTAHHAALIEVSGSSQLVASYQRLSIAWVWRSVWAEMDWQRFLHPRHLDDLTVALRRGDLTGAVAAIQRYHEEAKELARVAIAKRGGAL